MFLSIESKSSLIFVTLLIFLNACASNSPEPIKTTEHFTSRVDESGELQFAFGLLWQNSQVDPAFNNSNSNSNNDAKPAPNRRNKDHSLEPSTRRTSRFGQQPNNETKLDLEDLAALSLAKRLKKEALCVNGYKVEQVIWENQRIRLMGVCL